MSIRRQLKETSVCWHSQNNVIGGFMVVSEFSTACVEGDENISLNSKYAVMWRLLFPSSIAHQNIRIEIRRNVTKILRNDTATV
jgi:hypothetical protein